MHVHAHLNDELSDFTAMEIQSCMTAVVRTVLRSDDTII